ncbi:unnamed protein product, partial [Ectocarpus fasciculatus]
MPATSVAAPIVFSNTPNDPVGYVSSPTGNDGWADGRGMRFDMTSTTSITSFGVLHDVTNKILDFEILDVTNSVVLASGSTGSVSTTGLEFIDVLFPTIDLLAGNTYHMAFSFTGTVNQGFYH